MFGKSTRESEKSEIKDFNWKFFKYKANFAYEFFTKLRQNTLNMSTFYFLSKILKN